MESTESDILRHSYEQNISASTSPVIGRRKSLLEFCLTPRQRSIGLNFPTTKSLNLSNTNTPSNENLRIETPQRPVKRKCWLKENIGGKSSKKLKLVQQTDWCSQKDTDEDKIGDLDEAALEDSLLSLKSIHENCQSKLKFSQNETETLNRKSEKLIFSKCSPRQIYSIDLNRIQNDKNQKIDTLSTKISSTDFEFSDSNCTNENGLVSCATAVKSNDNTEVNTPEFVTLKIEDKDSNDNNGSTSKEENGAFLQKIAGNSKVEIVIGDNNNGGNLISPNGQKDKVDEIEEAAAVDSFTIPSITIESFQDSELNVAPPNSLNSLETNAETECTQPDSKKKQEKICLNVDVDLNYVCEKLKENYTHNGIYRDKECENNASRICSQKRFSKSVLKEIGNVEKGEASDVVPEILRTSQKIIPKCTDFESMCTLENGPQEKIYSSPENQDTYVEAKEDLQCSLPITDQYTKLYVNPHGSFSQPISNDNYVTNFENKAKTHNSMDFPSDIILKTYNSLDFPPVIINCSKASDEKSPVLFTSTPMQGTAFEWDHPCHEISSMSSIHTLSSSGQNKISKFTNSADIVYSQDFLTSNSQKCFQILGTENGEKYFLEVPKKGPNVQGRLRINSADFSGSDKENIDPALNSRFKKYLTEKFGISFSLPILEKKPKVSSFVRSKSESFMSAGEKISCFSKLEIKVEHGLDDESLN